MLKILLEMLFFSLLGLVVFNAGYEKGRSDLWDFLSRNYIVLHKGCYRYNSEVKVKKGGRRNVK